MRERSLVLCERWKEISKLGNDVVLNLEEATLPF
jgi:hypothetical protein